MKYLAGLAIITLTGCSLTSMTLPVKGLMENTSETFTGQATGYMDGSGSIKLISSNVTVCDGNSVYVSSRRGEGIIYCDDGRSGPFEFVSTGKRGTGFGTLNGQKFVFTFGKQHQAK